jgi:hypothetical protein
MKLNRIAAGVTALGLAAMVGAGTANAATTVTSAATPLIIKWQTVASAKVTVIANYTTGATPTTGATGTILQSTKVALTTGTCGTAGSTASNTLDFGSITPDQTNALACLYEQGALAQVVTNSTSWTLSQSLSAAPAAGFTLCTSPGANQTGSVTYTAPGAATINNTCTAAATLGTTGIQFGTAATNTTAGTTFIPEDITLITAANTAVQTQAPLTLTLTLVAS